MKSSDKSTREGAVRNERQSRYLYDAEIGNQFQLHRYRELVDAAKRRTCDELAISLTALTPFGFEVFRTHNFLSLHLKRFYTYLYASTPVNEPQAVEETYLRHMYDVTVEHDPPFADSIAVLAARTGKHILRRNQDHDWKDHDRLLVVEFRNTAVEPMIDYAHYLLSCSIGIANQALTESQRFALRRMARARIYQLALILAQVLGNHCLGRPFPYPALHDYLRQYQAGAAFYFFPDCPEPPSTLDCVAHEVIREYLRALVDAAHKSHSHDAATLVSVRAFHGDNILSITVPESVRASFVQEVEDSYAAFWRR